VSGRITPGFEFPYFDGLKSHSDLRLIIEMTLVALALNFAGDSFALLIGVAPPYRMRDLSLWPLVRTVLVHPAFETLETQWIPILITSYLGFRPSVQIVTAAAVFAVSHVHPYDMIRVLPGGFLLAGVFWLKSKESFGKAFLVTTAIHSLHNLICVAMAWLGLF
jgi:hypothetical protein